MRTIEPIVRWDVAFSLFCLKSRYSQQTAQISKAISHTGDGHLYLLFAIAALFLDEQAGQAFVMVGLAAFAIELPIYWLAKNTSGLTRSTLAFHTGPCFVGLLVASNTTNVGRTVCRPEWA